MSQNDQQTAYQSYVTSDAIGAFKSVMATTVGMIPEIGPFLSLGVNLFCPSKGNNTTELLEHFEKKLKRQIDQEFYKEDVKISDAVLNGVFNLWKSKVKEFKDECHEKFDTKNLLPTLNLDEISGRHLCDLLNAIATVEGFAENDFGIINIVNPSYKKISKIISFGSFHIGLYNMGLVLKKYIKAKYPKLYGEEVSGNADLMSSTYFYETLKVEYSNRLREAVADMNQKCNLVRTQIISSGGLQPYEGISYLPAPDSPSQFNGPINLREDGDPINSFSLPNFRRIKKCEFYNFIAENVFPVLLLWEQGIELSAIKPTSLEPDIPVFISPANTLPTFLPLLYDLELRLGYTVTFTRSEQADAYINDLSKKSEYTSNCANFEDAYWLQWGEKGQEGVPLFNVLVDCHAADTDSALNLTAGSIMVTPFDDDLYNFNRPRGYYPQLVDDDGDKNEGIKLNIYLATPRNISHQFNYTQLFGQKFFENKFQMPWKEQQPTALDLVGKGKVKHETLGSSGYDQINMRDIYTFSEIPTNNKWGAKIFDTLYNPQELGHKIEAYCNPGEWVFDPHGKIKANTPYSVAYAQIDPRFQFPQAIMFGVVLYQIDPVNKLIHYFPLGDQVLEYDIDFNLPLYVAVNDTIYEDNSGEISITINSSYTQIV